MLRLHDGSKVPDSEIECIQVELLKLSWSLQKEAGSKTYNYSADPKALTYADFLSLIDLAIDERWD